MFARESFMAWLNSLNGRSYYEILNVEHEADSRAIKEAFHRFALAYHPDRYVGEEEGIVHGASEVFKRGVEAYRVLSRSPLRTRYDRALASGKLRLDDKSLSDPPPRPKGRTLEEIAHSAKAKHFATKADRFLGIGQLEEARLQLVNACQCEPENEELSDRLTLIYEALALEPP